MIYPDISLVRFFFSNKLNLSPGNVIEFGSGSGSNLRLFDRYDWRCTAVDLPKFEEFYLDGEWKKEPKFIGVDLESPNLNLDLVEYDAILFPNILYYLKSKTVNEILECASSVLAKDGWVFSIDRLIDDYRFGKGLRVESNRFKLKIFETGEFDQEISFHSVAEIRNLFALSFDVSESSITSLKVTYENVQRGIVVSNSDVVTYFKR